MTRKFWKTTIIVEVLSEDVPLEFDDLEEVHNAISSGACSGQYTSTSEELTGKQCADALTAQGSDPGFFQLDDNGDGT